MPTHRRVDLALLGVAVVWGSSYLAAKDVATSDTVFGFLAVRFALAAIGLVVLLGLRLRRINRAEVVLGAVFGTILGVIFTLETFGLTMTSASNAGLIIALTIVMTPLLQQWIQRTRLPAPFSAATVVAVLGVGLLTQSGGFSTPGLGDLLMLLAAAARACHVVVMAQLSRGRRLDAGRLTLVQICVCLAVFTTAASISGRNAVDRRSPVVPRRLADHRLPRPGVHRLRLRHPGMGSTPDLAGTSQPATRYRTAVGCRGRNPRRRRSAHPHRSGRRDPRPRRNQLGQNNCRRVQLRPESP